jgi:hypothetical protein
VQAVAPDANPSTGHAEEDPVQFSATSHCPAEFLQVKVFALKASTQVLLVPLQ